MRVIAGQARGRRLKELPGMDTRPTTDKVKESLFNIIQFEIEGRRVLDLFGGTGQLGVEALSRGAAACTFVDQRRDAAKVIQENVNLCRFTEMARVVNGESLSFLATCREQFDLVFLDPPYHTDLMAEALESIRKFDILTPGGIIVCETAADQALPSVSEPYVWGRDYRYGKIRLTICRRQGERNLK